jgi:large subunit ribosomal protein L22|tara:strand:+ start:362 stop:868 length:507 start_codon:yes stop_codon:yes gene_type:complete
MVEEKKTKIVEEKKDKMVEEKKTEDKKVKKIVKKDVAIANGYSLRISPKYSIAVCKVVRGKSPDNAIKRLEDVIKDKRAIPMAGLEVAHQKGKGLAGAKFPKNVCTEIIEVIKQAKANSVVNGLDSPFISIAKSNRASAPFRKGGRRSKRTHIYIELRDRSKSIKKKK